MASGQKPTRRHIAKPSAPAQSDEVINVDSPVAAAHEAHSSIVGEIEHRGASLEAHPETDALDITPASPGTMLSFRSRSTISDASARTRLRRSERIHAIESMAAALRDRASPGDVISELDGQGHKCGPAGATSQARTCGRIFSRPLCAPANRNTVLGTSASVRPEADRRAERLGVRSNVATSSRVQLSPKRDKLRRRSLHKHKDSSAKGAAARNSSLLQTKVFRAFPHHRRCKTDLIKPSPRSCKRSDRLHVSVSRRPACSKRTLCDGLQHSSKSTN